MNRSHDNTCEHCRADLPRHVVGKVDYCSQECFEAEEGPTEIDPARDTIACTLAVEIAEGVHG